MKRSREAFGGGRRRGAVFASSILVLAALAAWSSPSRADWPEAEEGVFEGHWSVEGTAQILEYPDGRSAAAGRLTGTIVVQTAEGLIPGFETDCIVFSDSSRGALGRCVWTSTSGDLVFVEIEPRGAPGSGQARGALAGGTGRFRALQGHFDFEMFLNVRGQSWVRLGGQSYALRGRYRLR